MRKQKRRFDDDDLDLTFEKSYSEEEEWDETSDKPETGDRWSTWDLSTPLERGPRPYPEWLVTELAAVDFEHGVLKTGKEADACLITRAVPGTDRSCMLVAKRYRSHDHRMFHRDSGYLEGRKDRASRVNRAMEKRTEFGKEAIAGRWAMAEFNSLILLWQTCQQLGIEPFVPYPVQILGTEVLMQYVGSPDGVAAERLATVRGDDADIADLWQQMLLALRVMSRAGYTHGDLSPYNILVHEGRLVVIDLPQIVDLVANPQGRRFLERDVHNVVTWFAARGVADLDEAALVGELLAEAGVR
ncbi:RIO kinase 1 [Rhizocola hellebori]|uniref:non-specific serine/threonine protein kinase n=1 Tax=Rhizocola hellebori TaxID=1392758 RepID=A0A8J3VIT0_9ACTN|nr:RIO1 family regulatory kinase/ATPase [Rhizocola hellebori]GIH07243.1 RIO kinase 1 [Rhizocola hellebori]